MNGFLEVRFPEDIACGAVCTSARQTDVVSMRSGYEQRNAVWKNSRRSYDIGTGIKSLKDIQDVVAFFESCSGRLRGFRFKDYADYTSCPQGNAVTAFDQVIGTGDGGAHAYQLIKTYSVATAAWSRVIAKPVSGSVKIAVQDVEVLEGWYVDTQTGIVSFDVAPELGTCITAGFEFDIPVRFQDDVLQFSVDSIASGSVSSIKLLEIRL